jgi:hypothetical protein
MLRRSDLLGITGFTMMAAGAVLFLAVREDALPLYWLLGTTSWFIGFGVFLAGSFGGLARLLNDRRFSIPLTAKYSSQIGWGCDGRSKRQPHPA